VNHRIRRAHLLAVITEIYTLALTGSLKKIEDYRSANNRAAGEVQGPALSRAQSE